MSRVSADEAKPQAAGVAVQPTNPLDAQRAYGYLLELCAIGPRPSGSAGMEKQQALLEDFFKKAGGKVTLPAISGEQSAGRRQGADGEHHRRVASGAQGTNSALRTLRHAAACRIAIPIR